MCGRFSYLFSGPLRTWHEARFGTPAPGSLAARDRYNIAPTDPVVAITAPEGQATVSQAAWGFSGPHGPVFNARIESMPTSPLWAPHWGHHHAVVPATGFYEWTGSGVARTPYHITRTDDEPLLFAALVGGPPDALVVAILTCPPNDFMTRLHDRMPVVLEPHEVDTWLQPKEGTRWERLAATPGEVLDGHPVGKAVGDVHADGPALIEPVRAWF